MAHVRDRTVELEGKAVERFEQERRRRTWVEIGWQAWLRMRRRGGPLLSGGLAYRLFLFMIPAALLVVAVIGAFVDISGETPEQAAHDLGMGAALAATVAQAVSQSEANAWWLALLGLVLMLWAARSAVSALLIVSRIAWDEPPSNKVSTTRGAIVFTGFMFVGVGGQLPREPSPPREHRRVGRCWWRARRPRHDRRLAAGDGAASAGRASLAGR